MQPRPPPSSSAAGTLFDGAPCILRPALRAGRIPAGKVWGGVGGRDWRPALPHPCPPAQVLKWYDEPLAMFGRHYPDNYAHAVSGSSSGKKSVGWCLAEGAKLRALREA